MAARVKIVCFQNLQNAICEKSTLQTWDAKYEIKCPYSLSNENLFTCDNEI